MSRRSDTLLGRVGPGDIVIFDQPDIDRATAEALVKADVTAVVNTAASVTGRYPNLGPEILLASGIPLLDQAEDKIYTRVKDGSRVRIDESTVYVGEQPVATGVEQTPESIADLMIEAKGAMSAQLEAFAANAIEYMKRERTLLLDGVGIPQVSTDLADRQVLIVADSPETKAELRALKKYISDYKPVLIGVDAGADALRAAGHKPHLIVGNPDEIDDATLRGGAEVVIPAQSDGHAPGLERLQDVGVGAVTFPSVGTSEDLALLLADANDAALIVTVGMQVALTDLLDRGRGATAAATFLIRTRVADKIVQATTVARLYKARISWWAVLLLVLAAFAAIIVALLVSDVSGTYLELARQWWADVVNWVKGLF